MGKNKSDSEGGRREPYNQPIKIFAVAPEDVRDWGQIKQEALHRLNAVRLGRTIDARVGKHIGNKRACAGLSVEQFAARMKMSPARLKKIEAGKERLTLSLVQRVASALGCFLQCELV